MTQTYERKRKFVIAQLAGGDYHIGLSIIQASNGLLSRKTSFQTFDRMVDENVIRARGNGRAWERHYRLKKPWEK